MSQMLGMDVAAVRQLAKIMNQKAEEVTGAMNAIDAQLRSVQWNGKDADGFRNEWTGTHKTQLTKVAAALKDASAKATKNAAQQEQTSAS